MRKPGRGRQKRAYSSPSRDRRHHQSQGCDGWLGGMPSPHQYLDSMTAGGISQLASARHRHAETRVIPAAFLDALLRRGHELSVDNPDRLHVISRRWHTSDRTAGIAG